MKTTEFMFCIPLHGNEALRYSVIVVSGISVGFIRIGSAEKPFSLLVPRVHDETFAHVPAEHLARLAIAQAIYTELFNAHPPDAIDLDVHGPLWDGDLESGQWQHANAQAAPEPVAPIGTVQPQVAQKPAFASRSEPLLDTHVMAATGL
jgi:hypothetical protein